MKQLLYLAVGVLMFTACEEITNTAEPSQVTYLPLLTLNGDAYVELDCTTTSYDDPGITAEEQGQSIPVTTNVVGKYFGSSSVDGPDIYEIVYSAENKDGIPGAVRRTVVVPECEGDFVNSIGGVYTGSVQRSGGLSAAFYGDLGPFMVRDLGGGKFQISDAIGGYYDLGVGYGADYAATGMTVTANDISANDFTHDDVIGVGLFGGNLIMTDFSVDPATKTIEFTTEWDIVGDPTFFEVTLVQQ